MRYQCGEQACVVEAVGRLARDETFEVETGGVEEGLDGGQDFFGGRVGGGEVEGLEFCTDEGEGFEGCGGVLGCVCVGVDEGGVG